MSQSLEDQLKLLGLASATEAPSETQRSTSVRSIRHAPASSSISKTENLGRLKCEVGAWCRQELLEFGADRKEYLSRHPILLWRERDFRWIVFPGTSKERRNFFQAKNSDWHFFDESYQFNFNRNGFFCNQHETIDPICLDAIGTLNDDKGKKFRIWARKANTRRADI